MYLVIINYSIKTRAARLAQRRGEPGRPPLRLYSQSAGAYFSVTVQMAVTYGTRLHGS